MKPSFLITHALNQPCDRRAVDVHVEGRHEDAHATHGTPLIKFFANLDDATIGRAGNSLRLGRNHSLWVAEEVEDKGREDQHHRSGPI